MSAHVLLNLSNESGKSDIKRGFVIFQGIGTSIAKRPCILVFFRGVPTAPPPALDPRMKSHKPK